MSTCAICLSPAPAGYDQCRDCIATFGVKENPAKFAKELGKKQINAAVVS